MTARFPFPDRPRLWGVAVSHYQVEGNDPCDWSEWEAAGNTRGAPCGDAAGSWTRYEEDALLAHAAGANAFRFSISWSRVEPQRGVFDEAVLARYRRFVDTLVALGIEPIVTLFHYTHPRWFHEKTPWTSTASVLAFGRFAGYEVALSPIVVRNIVVQRTVRRALDRQVRWNKIRYAFSHRLYAAELLLNPLALALLAAPIAPWLPVAVAAVRCIQIAILSHTTRAKMTGRQIALTPILDLLMLYAWLVPFFSNSVTWRGYRARVGRDTELIAA